MKIDRGEDTCYYSRFVNVFISHLLHPKQFFRIVLVSQSIVLQFLKKVYTQLGNEGWLGKC